MVLHAAKAPAAILVNGEAVDVAGTARQGATGEWVIPVRAPASVGVILKPLTPGFAQLKDQLASAEPYAQWVKENLVRINDLP